MFLSLLINLLGDQFEKNFSQRTQRGDAAGAALFIIRNRWFHAASATRERGERGVIYLLVKGCFSRRARCGGRGGSYVFII